MDFGDQNLALSEKNIPHKQFFMPKKWILKNAGNLIFAKKCNTKKIISLEHFYNGTKRNLEVTLL